MRKDEILIEGQNTAVTGIILLNLSKKELKKLSIVLWSGMDNLETGISFLRSTRDFSLLKCAVFISALGFI